MISYSHHSFSCLHYCFSVCNCIKERFSDMASCLNFHPCVIKFSQPVSLALLLSLSYSSSFFFFFFFCCCCCLSPTHPLQWSTVDAEMKLPSAEILWLSTIPSMRPAMGMSDCCFVCLACCHESVHIRLWTQ